MTALFVNPAPLSVIESSHVVRDEMFVTLILVPQAQFGDFFCVVVLGKGYIYVCLELPNIAGIQVIETDYKTRCSCFAHSSGY